MRKLWVIMVALLVCGVFAVISAAPRPAAAAQSGQSSSVMTGTLTSKEGKFFLTDATNGSTVEVRGQGLAKFVGQRVSVQGQLAPGAAGSPQVLTATSVSRAAAVGSKAAAAGVKGGLSKAAIVGITGGATAATVGTLYATDVIGGEDQPASRR